MHHLYQLLDIMVSGYIIFTFADVLLMFFMMGLMWWVFRDRGRHSARS